MSGYGEEFLKRKMVEVTQEAVTVTVRLQPKYFLMLKLLSQKYSFPISTSFTELISKHLYDIMLNLADEDFDDMAKYDDDESFGSVNWKLSQEGLIEQPTLALGENAPDFLKELFKKE